MNVAHILYTMHYKNYILLFFPRNGVSVIEHKLKMPHYSTNIDVVNLKEGAESWYDSADVELMLGKVKLKT